MNKTLRQLFTAVITLFVILGLSTSIITTVRANALNNDTRNSRALYHELGAQRGSILASDGTVLATSTPSNDAFKYQRSYSNGPLYAPVTGYFSISQRADRGIESSYNSLLSGESDSLFWQRLKSVISGSDNKGATIETSINPALQETAYQALGDRSGALVAIEVKTGRILAMVSTPSYDPNALATHDSKALQATYANLTSSDTSPLLNNATNQLFPPGSTFKTVVAAAALESGKYQLDTQIPAGASYTLPGTDTQLTNAVWQANGSNGTISFEDALAYSSNTAFAQLGVALGQDAIAEQATKLGFGSSITIDSSNSSGTPMKATASEFPTSLSDDRLALASIGQGDVLETPLQNAMIAAAIANGGKLMHPTLVDRVRSSDLSVLSETKPSAMSTAFSADTANSLTAMMKSVAAKGTPSVVPDGISVAVKTGTAQIGQNNDANDGWVMGFAPADDPQIAVAVVVHDTADFGVTVAGPIFRSVIQEALKQ